MSQLTIKKGSLMIPLLWAATISVAQDFLPMLNDNYMGINQVTLQPAAIVDSRFKLDINLLGVNSEAYNDFMRMDVSKMGSINTDDFFSENVYLEFPDGKDKNAFMNQSLLGVSFMVTIKPKHAIGFTSRARYIANADDIDEPVARSMIADYSSEDYPDIADYWERWYRDENIRMTSHIFADYGLTYATEIFDNDKHYMKTGVTVKLLQGMGGAYIQADDFYYYYHNADVTGQERIFMSWNSPYAQMGVSDNWNWGSEENNNYEEKFSYKFIAKPSVGLDVGVVYEFRPGYKNFRYTMDGQRDLERKDRNKYRVKVGVSVLDIGRLRYEKHYQSTDFTAAFTPDYQERYVAGNNNVPANTHWMDIGEVVWGMPRYVNYADTVNRRMNGLGTAAAPENDKEFTIKLPTAISLQADVNIVKGLYVNLTTFTALNQGYSKAGNSHYMSNYSITPRYEHKWFGVMIPVSYNQYKKFDVGLGIRAAFLYFGINNIITALIDDPYGSSVYAGVKIPIWHRKPPSDMDKDNVSDENDKCIDIPGLWEFKGCPDTDGDGIPDEDDRCPKDPGPGLTSGCPDRDNDGVLDNADQCPDVAGPAQFNGCPDTDGDGIRDEVDRCPNNPGPQAASGCPDMDNDGVPDIEDQCPEQFGKPEYSGCPFQDSDGDGIMDENDLCPQQAGVPENNGCPWTDTDGDGVWDKDDRCPLTPGDPANFGCPVLKVEEAAVIRTAFENLEFETGKAVIRAGSFASLDALAKLLSEKPEWKLHIAGHTDNVGNDESNMKLSKDRAESTAKYLQGKGIDKNRFIVEWFGETKPVADNSTAEGRQKNRRVEMEIIFD